MVIKKIKKGVVKIDCQKKRTLIFLQTKTCFKNNWYKIYSNQPIIMGQRLLFNTQEIPLLHQV